MIIVVPLKVNVLAITFFDEKGALSVYIVSSGVRGVIVAVAKLHCIVVSAAVAV